MAGRAEISPTVRGVYAFGGLLLVGIGIAAYFIPGLPSTIFLILALCCFKRGSARFELWLLNHRWFGATLRDWDEHGWMTRRTKLVATTMMSFAILASWWAVPDLWVRLAIVALGVVGAFYIWTRPTKPVGSALAVQAPSPTAGS